MTSTRIVYTAGYAKLPPADLLKLATALDVTVCDIRGVRATRKPGYGSKQLPELLGARYQWWGDTNPGPSASPGQGGLERAEARAVRLMPWGLAGRYHGGQPEQWPARFAAMLEAVERPLMLCACEMPGDCHRHQIIDAARPLISFRAVHIIEGETVDAGELSRCIADADPDAGYEFEPWTTPADILAAWEAGRPRRPAAGERPRPRP